MQGAPPPDMPPGQAPYPPYPPPPGYAQYGNPYMPPMAPYGPPQQQYGRVATPWVPLVLSIVLIFMCWPVAIISIVFSVIAMVKAGNGDADGARTFAKIAYWLVGVFGGLGLLGWGAYVVMMVLNQR